MLPSLLERRKELLARSEAALERWSDRTHPEFVREMGGVTQSLKSLAEEFDRSGSSTDAVERARTWRYVATAHFDLGHGSERAELERAVTAFERAEKLLGGNASEPVERVKLAYWFGETLLRLSEAKGMDLELTQQARDRFATAIPLALTHMREGVAQLSKRQRDAEAVINLLTQVKGLDREIDRKKRELAESEGGALPVATEKPSCSGGAPDMQDLFKELQRQVDNDKNIDPSRLAVLQKITEEFGQVIASDSRKLSTMEGHTPREKSETLMAEIVEGQANRAKLEELMTRMVPFVKNPSRKGINPPAGSCAHPILGALTRLQMEVAKYSNKRGVAHSVSMAAVNLGVRLAKLSTWVSEAGNDDGKVRQLEADEARNLAHEARLLARRSHLMLARPVWPGYGDLADVNRIFYSGPARMRRVVTEAARHLSLEIDQPVRSGADFAESRWQDLRAVSVAVFDLSEANPQVYYELGIALALGTELLLLAAADTEIPFDVAQDVQSYSSEREPVAFVSDALRSALYEVKVPAARKSGLLDTLAYAERVAAVDSENKLLGVALRGARDTVKDPITFHEALKVFNSLGAANEHEVLLPRWPGYYPNAPRCFAVMPFRGAPERAFSAIAAAARKAGVEPVRGDLADGQQIIQSIWEEICRATHVTVDLTDFNPNVCLELGIAHTLGRPTRIIGCEGTERRLTELLPGVAKWRLHRYPRERRVTPEFRAMLEAFFRTRTGPLSRVSDRTDLA